MRTGPARILFVSGKGGTGKSFVAEALGREAASRGTEVVLVRVRASASAGGDGEPNSESAVSPPRRDARASNRTSAESLVAFKEVHLDEKAALEEFLTRVLPLGFVARRLLGGRMLSALAAAAPGLRDLVTLTAITALATDHRGHTHDLLVVDAPATTHGVPLLTAPTRVLEITPTGPLTREAETARELITDPRRFIPLIVTTPEELAVTEAISLHDDMRDAGVPAARVVVNGLWPARLAPEHAKWLLATRVSSDAIVHHKRRQRQLELIDTLERRVGRCPTLPFMFDDRPVAAGVIAALLDTVLGAA
ncbi:MAG: hypothetical protein HY899_11130 [Deltaproteobacteria bacterium]|nr:hypothetical protein [Deltaproteobacteria bacterium]